MTNDFTVGDYIVDFENIYQIYAAKSQKDLKGVYHQCFSIGQLNRANGTNQLLPQFRLKM